MFFTRTSSLIGIAFLSLLIAALHITAQQFFFYWTFWWYDIMMHGLGGLLIGLIAAWGIAFPGRAFPQSLAPLAIFLIVFVVGILWELFEYLIGASALYSSFGSYVFDTISDIAMDIAGALVSALMFKRFAHESR